LDTENIEKIAVNKIRETFDWCKLIQYFISDNDKTPSWDGYLCVYNSPGKKKDDLKYQPIPIQIKGTEKEDFPSDRITFQVSLADLKNYRKSHGTIFFVVYIKSPKEYKIYYQGLSGLRIKKYLKKMERKNTCSTSIELRPFPDTDEIEITNLIINFAAEMENKVSINREFSVEDIISKRVAGFDNFNISCTTYKTNPFDYLLSHQVTLNAHNTSADLLMPIDEIFLKTIQFNNPSPVTVGGEEFYSSFVAVLEKEKLVLTIGNGIIITIYRLENPWRVNFNYKLSEFVEDRIKDIKFLLAFFKANQFEINSYPMHFNIKPEDLTKIDLEYLRTNLVYLEQIKKLKTILSIGKDINFEKLTSSDFNNLDLLIKAFLNNQIVEYKQKDEILFQLLRIANIKIMFSILRINENFCNFKRVEKTGYVFSSGEEFNEKFPSTVFFIMQQDDFESIDNIDYEVIYSDIISVKQTKPFMEHLILFLLTILLAYDDMTIKDLRMLKFVEKVCDSFIGKTSWVNDEILILNKLQAIKRYRSLSSEEKIKLIEIANNTNDDSVKVGAYILYEDYDQADYFFSKLDEDRKKQFAEYPINKLWK